MRDTFAEEVRILAAEDKRVLLLTGDIGNKMFDSFKELNPTRYINCGIAEANMVSVAAGLAMSGMRPFAYTIAPFITSRCFEQIKVGLSYHGASVVLVGTGAGLSYAELGATHYSLEDIAIIKTLPDINILCPADRTELRAHLKYAISSPQPTYIRIGKKGEPDIHKPGEEETTGFGNIVELGEEVAIICIGPIIAEALVAAKRLRELGHIVSVVSLGSVRPLNDCLLDDLAKSHKYWFTVEEHGIHGGLGATILEWLNDKGISEVSLSRIAVPSIYSHRLGSQAYMRSVYGIDARAIARCVENKLKKEIVIK